ncbi:MAG: hypothetical protein ACNS62_02485 [Candidatus Cyclobacteriaceae bacterium M3_2C_046]
MLLVDPEDAFVAVLGGGDHVGLGEAVEFQADGVGGFLEFGFQAPEVSCCFRIKEEFQQEFDPGFGCD